MGVLVLACLFVFLRALRAAPFPDRLPVNFSPTIRTMDLARFVGVIDVFDAPFAAWASFNT